jgi:CRP-like cAMP-binding protein
LLADVARVEDISSATVLFREGQESGAVFLVVSGEVALEIASPNRGRLRFQTVGPGELLGWSPLLGQPLMTATARALTPAQVIRLEAAPLLKLCQEHPRFGMEVMRRSASALSKRLAATRLQLLDVFRTELQAASGEEAQA